MKTLLLLCVNLSLVLYGVYRFDQYEQQLVEARGEAAHQKEIQQALLSKGRFVRKYDQKTGHSVYTFKE